MVEMGGASTNLSTVTSEGISSESEVSVYDIKCSSKDLSSNRMYCIGYSLVEDYSLSIFTIDSELNIVIAKIDGDSLAILEKIYCDSTHCWWIMYDTNDATYQYKVYRTLKNFTDAQILAPSVDINVWGSYENTDDALSFMPISNTTGYVVYNSLQIDYSTSGTVIASYTDFAMMSQFHQDEIYFSSIAVNGAGDKICLFLLTYDESYFSQSYLFTFTNSGGVITLVDNITYVDENYYEPCNLYFDMNDDILIAYIDGYPGVIRKYDFTDLSVYESLTLTDNKYLYSFAFDANNNLYISAGDDIYKSVGFSEETLFSDLESYYNFYITTIPTGKFQSDS